MMQQLLSINLSFDSVLLDPFFMRFYSLIYLCPRKIARYVVVLIENNR